MGENELVLDSLGVDEALRLIAGAGSGGGAPVARAPREEPRDNPVSARDTYIAAGGDADWRAALRATGASPETLSAAAKKPRVPSSDSPPPRPSEPAPTPTATPAVSTPSPELSDVPAGLSVGTPTGDMFGAMGSLDSLEAVAKAVASCTKCPLYATAKNPVPGEGNPQAQLMCVGEAPGATEDETGRPFIGAAGQLLTKILEAINLPREQVYICNVLKHRPPGNRNPMPQEVTACSPYLIRQIELVRPKVILALGTFAAQTLLDTKTPMGKLRGQVHRYYGVPLIVTYHPAALLRNPSWKRPTWEDVQLARRILDSPSTGA
jgi:DNA polymerase